MMGFGSLGEGSRENSSLSISNLSALAPPFTVDRLNLNPMFSSNPVLNYSELSYAVEPYSHTSQFPSPSAPVHELDIQPTETSMSLNDYQISDPIYLGSSGFHWSDRAFVYGGGLKPYYSPSVPPMTGEGGTINEYDGRSSNAISPGLPVSSQLGYNQSFYDLEYGPQWADDVGFSDGMQVKTVGLGGDPSLKNVNVIGSHNNKIQVTQGIYDIPTIQKSQEVSGVPCGNSNRVSGNNMLTGQLALGNFKDRPFLEQNAELPYDCMQPCIPVSCSIFPESYSLGPSYDMHQNVSDFQNLCCPNENYVLPFDPSFPCSTSVMRPSPAVISRPLPSFNDILGKDTSSYRTTHTDNVAVVDFERPSSSKRDDSFPIPSYYIKDNFLSTASEKELTRPVQFKNDIPHEFKARIGSQLPDRNVSSGFPKSCDSYQVVYSVVDSSDFVEHCNPSVDSPGWKGASSSLYSASDVGPGDSLNKNLDRYYGIDHREHHNLNPLCDSTRFAKMGGESNNNDKICGRNSVYSLECILYDNSLNREQNLSDGANSFVGTSNMMSGEGIKMSNQPIFHHEPDQPKNSESRFDVKFLDTKHSNVEENAGLTLNDISEGGSVAVCAAEKVLASPSSQEAGYEHAKPLPDTKFDVQTMIKATYNLSELLLCHLSHDACCALVEKDMEIIKSTISNLNKCMRNNTNQETYGSKLKKCVRDTSIFVEDSRCMDKNSDGPCITNETFNCHVQPNYKHMAEWKEIESPVFSPLKGERIKRNDDMTKSIKEILEENFHINEEISSQALLFKSLWLEAEANLCSIGYNARFDQMKMEMAKLEANTFKESEDVAEMMSNIQSMPDPNTDSKLASTHGGTSPGPALDALKSSFISSMTENGNDAEASIMARFKILKSRGAVIESINMERNRQLEMGDGGDQVGSMVESFNILKSLENDLLSTDPQRGQQPDVADCDDLEPVLVRSNDKKQREDNLTPANKEMEPHLEFANDAHGESVMTRFNILQSREGGLRMYEKEEQQVDAVDVEFSCKKNVAAAENNQLEAPRRTGSLSEQELGSELSGFGYNSPIELHFSVPSDTMAHSFHNGKMMNQCYSRLHDTSLSSDWEHVQKDDLAWKKM